MKPMTEKRPTADATDVTYEREGAFDHGVIRHYYECVEPNGKTLIRRPESADALLGRRKLPTGRNATAEAVHDLRNILGTISMLTDLALLDVQRSSTANSTFQQIKLACADAKDLCERMSENQGTSSNVQQVDLATLVMAMVPLLTPYFRDDSSLRVNVLKRAPVANVAAAKIRQVVTNLVKNAAEALGDHPGLVTISTGVMELDARTYSFLDVCDTGCGMDDETSAQLFEHSFTTKFDGHGLGTVSIRRIVDDYGGMIQTHSQICEGTQIRVLFPQI
jgi:signal transduction histidine kinase